VVESAKTSPLSQCGSDKHVVSVLLYLIPPMIVANHGAFC